MSISSLFYSVSKPWIKCLQFTSTVADTEEGEGMTLTLGIHNLFQKTKAVEHKADDDAIIWHFLRVHFYMSCTICIKNRIITYIFRVLL